MQAAWLFRRNEPPAPAPPYYVFGLLATGDTVALKQDFLIVAHESRPKDMDFGVTVLDPAHPGVAKIMAQFPPFYAAPGFRAGGSPLGEAK